MSTPITATIHVSQRFARLSTLLEHPCVCREPRVRPCRDIPRVLETAADKRGEAPRFIAASDRGRGPRVAGRSQWLERASRECWVVRSIPITRHQSARQTARAAALCRLIGRFRGARISRANTDCCRTYSDGDGP